MSMTKREIRREANFRAGLILESLMNDWEPSDLLKKHGQDTVDAITTEILDIAEKLRNRGGRA
ncbi:hypothetical protein ABZ619_38705 [Streptomyces sp. NPDC007851]|uniref:hypothetical protein n=1 Tax=Streptomyces sp. NPDC007851 TaxID=3155008 RepID=UPI0033EAF40E